eukprot:CAMPEP_0202095948 /NCGR_PEP_ID=MMETSP0965-20130614/336_1 /ASSEMBLY_ACC=CAM_ASM_000507 /TAXON_ID=4773 /ORGANISM="Schizochytrium aggregatum, Strain ATCC28209" /LENGTH=237 /DNA_ID=CAMNT_0048664253 /DNA_START=92 /DNA_END=804 /DNA_ORIENTATION=+
MSHGAERAPSFAFSLRQERMTDVHSPPHSLSTVVRTYVAIRSSLARRRLVLAEPQRQVRVSDSSVPQTENTVKYLWRERTIWQFSRGRTKRPLGHATAARLASAADAAQPLLCCLLSLRRRGTPGLARRGCPSVRSPARPWALVPSDPPCQDVHSAGRVVGRASPVPVGRPNRPSIHASIHIRHRAAGHVAAGQILSWAVQALDEAPRPAFASHSLVSSIALCAATGALATERARRH